VMSYLNTNWYVKQLRNLTTPCKPGQNPYEDSTRIICQRPYDAKNGPRVYTNALAKSPAAFPFAEPGQKPPTKTILPLSDDQIDQIANNPPFRLQQAQVFKAGKIESKLQQDQVMLPADMFLGKLITTALGDRPVYFATTTEAYHDLRLDNQILRQGVAYKLINGPLQADQAKGVYAMPENFIPATGALIDFPRTVELANHVFVHHKGFPDDFKAWVDVATQQIPLYYAFTHLALAQAYAEAHDTINSAKQAAQADRYNRLANTRKSPSQSNGQ